MDSLPENNIFVLGIDSIITDEIRKRCFKNIQLQLETIDLLDYQAVEKSLVQFSPTYIVHLASFSSVSKSWDDPVASFKNNTNIFLDICEILRIHNIKCRLLSVGSSEEYGNVPVSCIPIKESMPLNPLNPYAIARVSQEMLSKCYALSYGVDIVLTRSFNHIGPGQRDIFALPSFTKQILCGIKEGKSEITLHTGDVSIVRDFVDVRDVVRSYHLLLERGITGELYNVCTSNGYSLKEIIYMLGELLQVGIILEEDVSKIRPNDNKIIVGDNSKIKEHAVWEPEISLMQSLQDLIAYWELKLGI